MDKFSELIAKGVAAFHHVPVAPEMPTTDPIVRTYNNLFGATTDTHMVSIGDEYMITGSLFKSRSATERAFSMYGLGAVDFRPSGYWSAHDFFCKNKLIGSFGKLNGDDVYVLTIRKEGDKENGPECCDCCCDGLAYESMHDCARRCMMAGSQIPHSIAELTTSGDPYHIMECYKDAKDIYEVVQRLNESRFVKGEWTVGTYSLFGMIGDKVFELL